LNKYSIYKHLPNEWKSWSKSNNNKDNCNIAYKQKMDEWYNKNQIIRSGNDDDINYSFELYPYSFYNMMHDIYDLTPKLIKVNMDFYEDNEIKLPEYFPSDMFYFKSYKISDKDPSDVFIVELKRDEIKGLFIITLIHNYLKDTDFIYINNYLLAKRSYDKGRYIPHERRNTENVISMRYIDYIHYYDDRLINFIGYYSMNEDNIQIVRNLTLKINNIECTLRFSKNLDINKILVLNLINKKKLMYNYVNNTLTDFIINSGEFSFYYKERQVDYQERKPENKKLTLSYDEIDQSLLPENNTINNVLNRYGLNKKDIISIANNLKLTKSDYDSTEEIY